MLEVSQIFYSTRTIFTEKSNCCCSTLVKIVVKSPSNDSLKYRMIGQCNLWYKKQTADVGFVENENVKCRILSIFFPHRFGISISENIAFCKKRMIMSEKKGLGDGSRCISNSIQATYYNIRGKIRTIHPSVGILLSQTSCNLLRH